jgi:hypothetical protein
MRDTKLEADYQHDLIERLEKLFPGCIILKNDSGYRQGIPDLVVFYYGRYAMLEVKPYETAKHRPNQDWYIELFDSWSFGAFIFPENEREVLSALQQSFGTRKHARVPKSKQLPLDQV